MKISLPDEDGVRIFWCPGCGCGHFIDHRWTVSGTEEAPTVTPSVKTDQCHFFVREGRIKYLSDSSHGMAGVSVPMVDLDKI